KKDLWLSVISISNNSLVGYDLEDRVRSRIGREEVLFPPYSKSEIFQILKDRASFGLAGMIPDEILDICAEKSSKEHGDCRRAIDLLRTAVDFAGPRKVTEEHVNKAEKYLGQDNLEISISHATQYQRLILGALCLLALNSGKPYHTTSNIFSKCEVMLIGSKIVPLSYRRFYDLVADLEGSGLVVKKTRSRGRYGYASEWALSSDENMVGNALDPKWWEDKRIEKHSFDEFKEQSRRRWDARKKGIIC